VLVRNDGSIDFDWGSGSPGSDVPDDNFSARWTRRIDFRGGTYLFSVRVDDGARLWVDDTLVIDSWKSGSSRLIEKEQAISDGRHRVKVEYFERDGDAEIEVDWQRQQPTNQKPQANPGGPYTVNEGSTLTLRGSGSRDPDGRIVKYEWDFNYDGQNFEPDAEGETVNRIYQDGPATRQVALRVADDQGAHHLATTQVVINNLAPTANAGGPYAGQVGSPIRLTGTATDPSQVDASSLVFTWDLGDGQRGNGPQVSHSYAQPGTYTVRLVVTDKDGGRNEAQTTVEVKAAQQPPTAVINGPAQGLVAEPLTFSASGSSDADGQIVSYDWDFGDGMTGSGREVTYTYERRGRYTVSLVVTDNDGLRAGTGHEVTIQDPPPPNKPPVAAIAGPDHGLPGETLTFSASGSSDSDGQIVKYDWNFGDQATGSGVEVTHSYAAPGDYQVTLTVTDDGGLTGQATHPITIDPAAPENQPPTAVISATTTAVRGQPVQFDASGSSDPDGQIARYVWDFGDNTTRERGVTVTHVYQRAGTYQVTLRVVDDGDLAVEAAHSITVNRPPENQAPTAVISAPTTAVVGQPVQFDASGSSDPDGQIARYVWDFGDNTTREREVTVTHVYQRAGTFQVMLRVVDDREARTEVLQAIEVQEAPPISPAMSRVE
jgi:PKD repeat protein